jgi:shikimate kinase
MMGVGKSTAGPVLAARLGCAFFDLDDEIEKQVGASVAEIFARDGEAGFRRLERECLEGFSQGTAVVALGGGTIAQPGVSPLLAEWGTVVYLKATPEQLMGRLGDGGGRPLLEGLDAAGRLARLEGLLAEREIYYTTARVTVDAGVWDTQKIVEKIVQRVVSELERQPGRAP